MSALNEALRVLESTEANLSKLEDIWAKMRKKVPQGIAFGQNGEYERLRMAYERILDELPEIDGWKPDEIPRPLDAIAQARLDAQEIGEAHIMVSAGQWIEEPGEQLRKYRFEFDQKRRELVREAAREARAEIDGLLEALGQEYEHEDPEDPSEEIYDDESWQRLDELVSQLETLLGSLPRPDRWSDLRRHLHFGQRKDLHDIIKLDWPEVRAGLENELYGAEEALPVDVQDLSRLKAESDGKGVVTQLNWDNLSSEDFERLLFALFADAPNYEDPEWLTHENAPDRGNDIIVTRVSEDPLRGTTREHVVVQCKHWLSRSVSAKDVSTLADTISLCEPPPVDTLTIATSGRFSSDAVELIKKRNRADRKLTIEPWPESKLEMILAQRPKFIPQFKLR